jgi:hypothetical protein
VARDLAEGMQMGDFLKKPDPKFIHELILPKTYPTKDSSYTRHQSPLGTYWEIVMKKFDEKLKHEAN